VANPETKQKIHFRIHIHRIPTKSKENTHTAELRNLPPTRFSFLPHKNMQLEQNATGNLNTLLSNLLSNL